MLPAPWRSIRQRTNPNTRNTVAKSKTTPLQISLYEGEHVPYLFGGTQGAKTMPGSPRRGSTLVAPVGANTLPGGIMSRIPDPERVEQKVRATVRGGSTLSGMDAEPSEPCGFRSGLLRPTHGY